MEIIRYPAASRQPELTRRPLMDLSVVRSRVEPILAAVRRDGEAALRKFTRQFDGVELDDFAVGAGEFSEAEKQIAPRLAAAIRTAIENIRRFHAAQAEAPQPIETQPGVICWRKSVPIERVGLYIPGGSSPLFSTVLMLGVPAALAGCSQIVLCSPPDREGKLHPAVLFCARELGIEAVFKIGGAQAIAALAYGTTSIPKVDKIFGPGNQYVTAAKQLVSLEGTAIDLPAGPSEAAVVADHTARAEFIAADLLSQAEHGPDSQVLLLTDQPALIEKVARQVESQLQPLPRREIARQALRQSKLMLMHSIDEALDFINLYAPEHLILMLEQPEAAAAKIRNAGSVFLGHFTPEAAGDYASGTNHTLPTNGFARAYSGVSLDSFVKKITFQSISEEGLRDLGPVIETLAEAEGLQAHREAAAVRRREIGGNHV